MSPVLAPSVLWVETCLRTRVWADGSPTRSNNQTWEEIRDPAVDGTMAVHLAAAKESSEELRLCVQSSPRSQVVRDAEVEGAEGAEGRR